MSDQTRCNTGLASSVDWCLQYPCTSSHGLAALKVGEGSLAPSHNSFTAHEAVKGPSPLDTCDVSDQTLA